MLSAPRRVLLGFTLAALCLCSSQAFGDPATRPAAQNPEYEQWAGRKDGAWIRVRALSSLRDFEWTAKLTKLTADAAFLDVTEARPGEKPGPAQERRVPAVLQSTGEPTTRQLASEVGEETLPVADVELTCHRETHGRARPGESPTSGDTTWTCPGIPGFVKKLSWLPADRSLNLPEATATEVLVAFNLPKRVNSPEPATTSTTAPRGQLPIHAEPPDRFSFTYTFEPRGWRKWLRVDEGHWEERWETGQVVKTRVVGWIADDKRRGTLVRRLDDSMETVIPDAGKGASLWFRSLPNGKWSVLGQVEDSSVTPEPADEKQP